VESKRTVVAIKRLAARRLKTRLKGRTESQEGRGWTQKKGSMVLSSELALYTGTKERSKQLCKGRGKKFFKVACKGGTREPGVARDLDGVQMAKYVLQNEEERISIKARGRGGRLLIANENNSVGGGGRGIKVKSHRAVRICWGARVQPMPSRGTQEKISER